MTQGRLDETDVKILDILQQNGRMEVTRIAKRVHKSVQPVHDRIHKLQEAGFIKGYIALLDRALIGKPVLVITLVKLENQNRKMYDEFAKTVRALPDVQCCLQLSGKWDFMLQVTAATPQDYYVLLMEKICSLPNVDHVESSFVLQEIKNFGPYEL